jgi:hypothetical protein
MDQSAKEPVNTPSADFSLKDLVNSLASLLRYLKSKWRTIVIYAIVGASIGITYSFLKKPVYTAEMTFTVEADEAPTMGISGIAEQFGLDLGSGKGSLFEGDNIILFFQSRAMVQKTLLSQAQFGDHQEVLINRYIDFNNYRDKWSGKSALENIKFTANEKVLTRLQDSVLGEFYKEIVENNLSVSKVDKKLSIIGLSCSCKDELFAKIFAETLTANVIDFDIKARTKKSQHNIDILQTQTDSVRRVLNGALSGMAESSDAEPNANPLKQVLRVPSQKRAVDAEASKAVLTELVKNLELSKIALRKETPLIEYIDQPILPLKVTKVGKITGLAIGFIIGAVASVFLLTAKKMFNHIMK